MQDNNNMTVQEEFEFISKTMLMLTSNPRIKTFNIDYEVLVNDDEYLKIRPKISATFYDDELCENEIKRIHTPSSNNSKHINDEVTEDDDGYWTW